MKHDESKLDGLFPKDGYVDPILVDKYRECAKQYAEHMVFQTIQDTEDRIERELKNLGEEAVSGEIWYLHEEDFRTVFKERKYE